MQSRLNYGGQPTAGNLDCGFSGRSVEMSQEEYQQAKLDLAEQLLWIGELVAQPQKPDEPGRMTMEHALVCWNTGIEPQQL